MKTAAELYASFQRAGFLVPAEWTSKPGDFPIAGAVRFLRPTTQLFGDDGVVTTEPGAKFPASQFVGIKAGDRLDIEVQPGTPTAYRVRQVVGTGSAGAETLATLVAWS